VLLPAVKVGVPLEGISLLGVYDGNRMGALRFKLDQGGDFLNKKPWIYFRRDWMETFSRLRYKSKCGWSWP